MLEERGWSTLGSSYLGGNSVVYYVDYLRKWNLQTYEGEEHTIIGLKQFLLLSLFDWMTAMSGLHIFFPVGFPRSVFICIIFDFP